MMKQVYASIWVILCSLNVSAQSIYESPYVHDGLSFELDIPKGLYRDTQEIQFVELAIYVSDTTFKFDLLRMQNYTGDLLTIMHTSTGGKSLEDYMLKIIKRAENEQIDDADFTTKPKVVEIKGREFLISGFKGKLGELKYEHFYSAVTIFGNYYIGITALSLRGKGKINSMRRMKKILKSFKLVVTGEKNGLEGIEFNDIEEELEKSPVEESQQERD